MAFEYRVSRKDSSDLASSWSKGLPREMSLHGLLKFPLKLINNSSSQNEKNQNREEDLDTRSKLA